MWTGWWSNPQYCFTQGGIPFPAIRTISTAAYFEDIGQKLKFIPVTPKFVTFIPGQQQIKLREMGTYTYANLHADWVSFLASRNMGHKSHWSPWELYSVSSFCQPIYCDNITFFSIERTVWYRTKVYSLFHEKHAINKRGEPSPSPDTGSAQTSLWTHLYSL